MSAFSLLYIDDQEMWSQERCQPWHRDAVTWAQVKLVMLQFLEAVQLECPPTDPLALRARSSSSYFQTCRAPVLAIDPPPHAPALPFKMALVGPSIVWYYIEHRHCSNLELPNFHQVGHLPLSHPKDGGQLYLANMGIPKNVYKEVILRTHFPRINSAQHYFRLVSSLPLPLAPSL